MELSERQEAILRAVNARGRVVVDELAEEFGVTTQTIRRDLNLLCDRGLAARMHGGARKVGAFPISVSNLDYEDRRLIASGGKEAIGARAASLIPDNCSVMINIGTTTEQVARALKDHKDLVVISNNVNVITSLLGSRAKELILAGGAVRPSDGAIVGEDAVEFISRYKTDYAIIGASAIDEDGAVLDYDAREVSVARAILRNARTRILVADGLKFERTAPVRICDIADVDVFITDIAPPPEFADVAAENDTRVIVTGEVAEDSLGTVHELF